MVKVKFDLSFDCSKEYTEQGLLNLIEETFDTDVSGFKILDMQFFNGENGENYIITCFKKEGIVRIIKVFHVAPK